MMGYGGYRMMAYGFGWIMMLGFFIIIILAVVALVRYLQRQNRTTTIHYSNLNAINILNERYAKGEITDEEYKKIKNEINS